MADSTTTGAAGEHYVMFRLLRKGLIAALAPCPFRKSYPDVSMMQPSQDRNGDNGARSLDRSMQGHIFL